MAESQADTATTDTHDHEAQQATDTDVDWKAEADKYKALHRKQEERAKANAAAVKELESLKKQSMTDLEKAVADARAEAAAEAAKTFGGRLVDAEVKAAAAGRALDIDAVLDGLDRTRFLTDDGEPDVDAITGWVDRIAPPGTDAAETPTPPFVVDLGQGNRGQAGSTTDPLVAALTNLVGVSKT